MTRRAALRAGLALAALLIGCPRPDAPTEPPRRARGHAEPLPLGATIHDPVTGVECVRAPTTEVAVHRGKNFYFCSDENRRRFVEDPGRFAYD